MKHQPEKKVHHDTLSSCLITDEDIKVIEERKRKIASGEEELIDASVVLRMLKRNKR